jgi:hypothetical protein
MKLNFDVGDFFVPECYTLVDNARQAENAEYLGDMLMIKTLIVTTNPQKLPFEILSYFGVPYEIIKIGESVWEIVEDIRIKVFTEMLALTGDEYRIERSCETGNYCLFFRSLDTNYDSTKNLAFVKKNTQNLIEHSEIKISTVHGFGLFATEDIQADETIGSLDGQVISYHDYESLRHSLSAEAGRLRHYFFMEWNALPGGKNLLARPLRTSYSYINHSTRPNLILVHGSSKVLIVALREIKAGEEFFVDYRKEDIPREYFTLLGSCYLAQDNPPE